MKLTGHVWVAAIMAAAVVATGPAVAQDKPATAITKPSDSTTITIFGSKPRLNELRIGTQFAQGVISHPKEPGAALLDAGAGSSCAFMGGAGIEEFASPNGPGIRINGPLGNAYNDQQKSFQGGDMTRLANSAPARGETTCGADDRLFAAGRADIYIHDTSLREAFAAFDGKDYKAALPLFETAYTKLGTPSAGLMAGKMYLFGLGTPRDTAKAISWLRKVAEAPSPPSRTVPLNLEAKTARADAALTLANIYFLGWDVPQNPVETRKWILRAYDLGYYPAAHMLGRIYQTGYAGEKNITKAVDFYKQAALVGYAPSQYALGQIYYFGDEGVAQDKTLAGAWLIKAAERGDPDALYAVARMYELGEGGAKADPQRALVYYKEAAIKGQTDAQFVIGVAFYNGSGVPQDLASARQWFLSAAERGHPDAMFNLAVMMTNGEGGPKDLVRAYCWFYIADKGGVEKAGAAMQEVAAKMTPDERAQADALLNPKPAA